MQVFCSPVLDYGKNPILIIEYISDCTDANKKELSINLLEEQKKIISAANRTVSSVLRYLCRLLDDDNFQLVQRQLEELFAENTMVDMIKNKLTAGKTGCGLYRGRIS